MTAGSARGRGYRALTEVTGSNRTRGHELLGCGPVHGPARRIIPARRVPSVRLFVSSVQAACMEHVAVLLVTGRSPVRIRAPAPQVRAGKYLQSVLVHGTNDTGRICACCNAKGHIEQLPSGRSGSPCMPGRLNSAAQQRCPYPVGRDSCVSIGVVAGSRSCLQKLLTPTRQQRR